MTEKHKGSARKLKRLSVSQALGEKISVTRRRYKHQIVFNLLAQRFIVWELYQKQNSGCAAGREKGYKLL